MKKNITDSIQSGEGNFLRAFVDYCIQILNDKTSFSFKTLDTIAPTVKNISETIVAGSRNIILNFSEPVDVERGSIAIYKRSNDSLVETIDIRSSQVLGTNTNQIKIIL